MQAYNLNIVADIEGTFSLKPKVHPAIQAFLRQSQLLHMLADGFGSPLNIVFPQNVDENIKSFQSVYKKHHLRGRIYFTSKPCKSHSIVHHASLSDIGIDVSSPNSLKHALAGGFSPDRIEATGPKNADYILKCLQLDVLMNVDSVAELHLIKTLRAKLGLVRKARVMLRVSGFSSPRMSFTPQDNTFGTHAKDIPAVIDWLVSHKKEMDFQGFSFHASRMNEQQRLVSIEGLLDLTFLAKQKNLHPKGINIGGGFSIQYADNQENWEHYTEALKISVLDQSSNLIWNNEGLGFKDSNGVVSGSPRYIDHYPALTKGDELDHWLQMRSPAHGNGILADIIRDSLLELSIEPGRGMLDQCGITLGKVTFVKKSTSQERLVGLDMNQSNNHSNGLKQLCDPAIIPRSQHNLSGNNEGVYFMGNLCVSYDILQYNKTFPSILPARGDLVAFHNTAAYMMDFVESETVMQPVAKKIAVWQDGRGSFKWAEDEKYLPVDIDEVI